MNKVFLALGAVVSTVVGISRLAVRTAAVIAVLVVFSTAFLLAPQYMPVPNAWAEYSSGALKALSTVSGAPENLDSTTGALHTYEAFLYSFERLLSPTPTGTGYASVSEECKPSGEIDLASGDVTVWNGPAILCGYIITVTPGTADSSIADGATAKIPLPVSFPVNSYSGHGAFFENSLKLKRGASATGKVVLMYRPLDPTTTWAQ